MLCSLGLPLAVEQRKALLSILVCLGLFPLKACAYLACGDISLKWPAFSVLLSSSSEDTVPLDLGSSP